MPLHFFSFCKIKMVSIMRDIAVKQDRNSHPPFLFFLTFFEIYDEETLFKSVLDKINLVGHDGHALFFVDKDLAAMAKNGTTSIMTDTTV